MKEKFYIIVITPSGRHRTTRRLIFGYSWHVKSRFSAKYNSFKEAQSNLQDRYNDKIHTFYISTKPID